jgi:cardiolipin synthase
VSPELLRFIEEFRVQLLVGTGVFCAAVTSVHAVLFKRDSRSAIAWVSLMWLSPILGSLLYVVFGINRVERRAVSLRRKRRRIEQVDPPLVCTDEELREALGPEHAHLVPLARVGKSIYGRELLEGNLVEPLIDGEEAYPAMLEAIDGAKSSVSLLVYIFEKDDVGDRFIDALARAAGRGVECRVLLDAVGAGSTRRQTVRAMAAAGVRVEVFQPPLVPWRTRYMNLRNHRKILVVDGVVGFTGGMNIRRSHCVKGPGERHEQDVQFRIRGPVVEHLQEAFVDDWAFATGEVPLRGRLFPQHVEPVGPVAARGVPFDPGEKLDTLRCVLVGALAAAQRTVRIVNPYFLPDSSLVSVLNVAALRGVEVDILIPEKNDTLLVHWAMEAQLWQVLAGGCRVWRTPPPFEHTKLMVVDGAWTFLGSANLDPRSLRLNFEFNVECYDRSLGARVEGIVLEKRERSKPVALGELQRLSFPRRLRNGVARLFTPLL